MLRKTCLAWVLCLELSPALQAQDNVPPSQSPPAGLDPQEVPMFVVFVSDDNWMADGNRWLVDSFFADRSNPSSVTANPATYDGAPVHGAFMVIGSHESYGVELRDSLIHAYQRGHEIGNHSYSHSMTADWSHFTAAQWRQEILGCNAFITRPPDGDGTLVTSPGGSVVPALGLGVPASQIYGFRSPFDANNRELWPVLVELGFTYEATIRTGWQFDRDGTNENWNYTLDAGSPDAQWMYDAGYSTSTPPDPTPGFWANLENVAEMPPALEAQYGPRIGFEDWFWIHQANIPPEQWVDIFRHNLDVRLSSNRAPMQVGLHGQNFAIADWFTPDQADYVARSRAALVAMMDYALSKPEVRVVSPIELIRWMLAPTPLGAAPEPPPLPPPPVETPAPTPSPSGGQGGRCGALGLEAVILCGLLHLLHRKERSS